MNKVVAKIHNTSAAFTIVELLVVVVVIAILAAVTIIGYNGIQARATFSGMRSDISSLQKALENYHTMNGEYPDSSLCVTEPGSVNYEHNWCGWSQGTNDSFIPGLVPQVINKTPTLSTPRPKSDTYLYQSRAADCDNPGTASYQLIRFNSATGLNSVENSSDNMMRITGSGYDNIAWGVRSSNCTSWW